MKRRPAAAGLCVCFTVILVGAAAIFAPVAAWAGADSWLTGMGGNFNDGAKWNDGTTPGSADSATFNVGGTYTVTFQSDVTNQDLFVQQGLVTFASSGGPWTYTLSGGGGQNASITGGTLSLGLTSQPLSLAIGNSLSVQAAGTLNVNSGSSVSANNLRLGTTASGSTSSIVVDASTLNITGIVPQLIGDSGGRGQLTFQNGGGGDIGGTLTLAGSGTSSVGNLTMQGGGNLYLDDLVAGNGGLSGQSSIITVTGAGSAIMQGGASALTLGAASNSSAVLNAYSNGTFSTGTGTTTVNATGWINADGGTFIANGNINLNGGLLYRGSTGTFTWAAGKTMTLQNHGGAFIAGDYSLPTGATVNAGSNSPIQISGRMTVAGGSQVNLSTGANLAASGPLDVGTGGTNGTLVVDGSGSTASSSSWDYCVWGAAGGAAAVTYRNGASGSINYLTLVGDSTPGTSATVNVESGASLSPLYGLNVNTAGGNTSATVTATGVGTNVGVNGALIVGHAGTGTATVNVNDGAMLSTTSSASITINKTGTVNINGGTLRLRGHSSAVTVDGGTLNKSASGLFDYWPDSYWYPGFNIFVKNGGQVNLTGGWAPDLGYGNYPYSIINVTGAGSRLRTLADGSTASSPSIIAGRANVSVKNGGEISAADRLWGTGILTTVDGAGSKAVSGAMQQSWSRDGTTAAQPGGIRFPNTFVTNGGLLAAGSCIDVAGTLVVDGSGSSATAGPVYSKWANDGMTAASVTFSGGSTGYFPGGIHLFADASSTGMSWAPDGSTGVTMASFKANLRVEGGAKLTTGDLVVNSVDANTMGATFAGKATVTVTGHDSAIIHTDGTSLVLGVTPGEDATLNVEDGGTYDVGATGTTVLNPTGVINIDGGIANLGTLVDNGGNINFLAGALSYIGDLTVGAGGLLGQNLTLAGNRTLSLSGTTTVEPEGILTLDGGVFSTGGLSGSGAFQFLRGTLNVTGAGGLTVGASGPLGSPLALGTGCRLNVTGPATVSSGAMLTIDGGGMTAASFINAGTVTANSGGLTVGGSLENQSTGRLMVGTLGLMDTGGELTNAGRIEFLGGSARLGGAGALTNSGLILGDGEVAKNTTNTASGEVRVAAGKQLTFSGTFGTNAGKINLQGGTAEFVQGLVNGTGGLIIGRGTLSAGGQGITNNGNMAFSAGITDIFGDVANSTGEAKIITSGAGTTTFWDDVVHNGAEIRTSAGCATVFMGSVSGSGSYTGEGTVYLEGDLSPGNSPASVSFESDLVLGSTMRLVMEIGGPTPGLQYDVVGFGGNTVLDGTLEVALLGGFMPQAGQEFDILNFDPAFVTGHFDAVELPVLIKELSWDTSGLYTQGAITVAPEPATLALMGLGLALGLGRKRRR